jgi:hypothetical protein
MTMQQFQQLDEIEKLSVILQSGRLLAQNIEENKRIFLYRLGSFYVSATYSTSDDSLTELTTFLELDQTAPHFRKLLITINPAEREYDTPEI